MIINKAQMANPGPQDYMADQANGNEKKAETGEKKPFGVNSQRFQGDEDGVPGAGTYKLPDSCNVKQKKHAMASYRSTVQKGLDQVIGKENPGIGEYDTQHLKTISNKELQGGCANNFSLFTKLKYQGRSPEIKMSPRIANLAETTPQNIGPGSYINKGSS